MDIVVETLGGIDSEVEFVEHKGVGHPDTICDALAEQFSVALSRFYIDNFGAILHHNVDKALLWGGSSHPRFGGGDVVAPMEIFLAGRATREAKGMEVPVEELALDSSRRWLRAHLHALDAERHVKLHCLVRSGSPDLVDLFLRQARTGTWVANDSSCGAGYAPLSALERVVLGVAGRLRELSASPESLEVGEDTKVLGLRRGDQMRLTVACAFVDRFVPDLRRYADRVSGLKEDLAAVARRHAGADVEIALNAADDLATSNVYLTVTGTSGESGDDGQVGRGNRVNGLIAPYRPMTLEAAAGKNPVAHVGKLYNLAAHRIASAVAEEIAPVIRCHCHLASRIGRPIGDPEVVDLSVRLERGVELNDVTGAISEIARKSIAEIGTLWEKLIAGEIHVF